MKKFRVTVEKRETYYLDLYAESKDDIRMGGSQIASEADELQSVDTTIEYIEELSDNIVPPNGAMVVSNGEIDYWSQPDQPKTKQLL